MFEHHPERNVRSLLRTAVGTWRPMRFWTSVHPVQPSRPRRLLIYWFITASVYVLAVLTPVIYAAARNRIELLEERQSAIDQLEKATDPNARQWAAWAIQNHGSIEAFIDAQMPMPSWRQTLVKAGAGIDLDEPLVAMTLIVAPLGWPWFTFAALMIFRISMRRVRIRTSHVLRCVIYSYDHLLWIGAILGTGMLAVVVGQGKREIDGEGLAFLMAWLLAAMAVTGFIRLVVAYDLYLRFDRPVATVVTSQIIAGLVMLNLFMVAIFWLD